MIHKIESEHNVYEISSAHTKSVKTAWSSENEDYANNNKRQHYDTSEQTLKGLTITSHS